MADKKIMSAIFIFILKLTITMSDIKKVLDIQFNGQQSIKDLKNQINQLKSELDNCVAGSEAAKQKTQELTQAQNNLKAAMKGCVDETGKLDQSYNGLSVRMAKLKAAQKEVDLSTRKGRQEYKDYAKEIDKINNKLKDADAQNGVYSRNVGNYANSIKEAFSGMGGAVGGVITSITSGLKMLVTNPWVAVLTLIVAALKELVDAFKRNSDAMKSAEFAGNNLKAVYVAIQRAFDALVPKVIELGDKITELYTKIKNGKIAQFISKGMNYIATLIEDFANTKIGKKLGLDKLYTSLSKGFSDFTQQLKKDSVEAKAILDQITEANDKLQKKHIANLTANAQAEAKIAALQADIADRENFTVEQRLEKLDEVNKFRKQIAAREVAELQERLKIMQLQHSLNQSNNEDLQAEAELRAQIIKAQSQAAQADREYNNQRRTLLKEQKKDSNEAEKDRKKALEAEIKAAETEKSLLNERLNLTRDYSDERYAIQEELIQKEEDIEKLKAEKEITDTEELQKALLQIEEKYALKRQENASKRAQDKNEENNKNRQNALAQSAYENGSSSLQYFQDQLDAARDYYNSLEQLQNESNADYEARQIAALQDIKDKEQQLNQARVSNYMQLANGISSIMSSVASAWESSIRAQIEAGELSEKAGEKQFEGVKALQIAIATVQTIAGAVGAFMGITKDTGGWGIALAAVEAAAVTAAGIAQIAQIKKTTLGSSSPSSAGSTGFVLPQLEAYTPNYTQNITGANDTANLQESVKSAIESADIKAYVVESEITSAQRKASKRNTEATW